jgi:hypothetical protein
MEVCLFRYMTFTAENNNYQDMDPRMRNATKTLEQQQNPKVYKKHTQLKLPAIHQFYCDRFFGQDQLVKVHNGTCIQHKTMEWMSCRLPKVGIDTSKIDGSLGGETFESVLHRDEKAELLQFRHGALLLLSEKRNEHPFFFNENRHEVAKSLDVGMMNFLQTASRNPQNITHAPAFEDSKNTTTTLLVRRSDYANPCWVLVVMYNVYIVLQQFGISTGDVQIVWVDGHAQGNLDTVWQELFGRQPIHIKQLSQSNNNNTTVVALDNVIVVNSHSAMTDRAFVSNYRWRQSRSNTMHCSLDPNNHTLVAYRDFVLDKYGMNRKVQEQHTNNHTGGQLTLLVRKNYRAHPRSNGRTDRVLANVPDDVAYLESEYPHFNISVVSFEDMHFRQQLSFITQTDVLVAVHGAGNIHTLFLPNHATLVEYFPNKFEARMRFRYLAECLNLTYIAKQAWNEEVFDEEKVSVRLRPLTTKEQQNQFVHQFAKGAAVIKAKKPRAFHIKRKPK